MIILIDGNHLACRNYYSLDTMVTRYGKETHCIYGVLNSFRKIYKRFKGENSYFFVTWDLGGPTRRHEIDPNYKGDRVPIGGTFYDQVKDVRDVLGLLDVSKCVAEGVEADDIIGTLTKKARQAGHQVAIISADHDFEQLISKHVTIYAPSSGRVKEIYKDVEYVIEKYGVRPSQMTELMALTGDSTDNIEGLDGVGPKKAAGLLKANGGLQGILDNVNDLKNLNKAGKIVPCSEKLAEKVQKGVETIKLARRLVEIQCDIDVSFELKRKKPDFQALKVIFQKLEFQSFLNLFDKWKYDLTE